MSSKLSLKKLIIFATIFGLVGGYALWHALASPNPNLQGDLNNDNTVNVTDLSTLLSNFNTTNAVADINADGQVNVLDLSILLSHYGQNYNPSNNVPAGKILYVGLTDPANEYYVNNPSATDIQWMNDHWYRAYVFGNYWNSTRLAWYNRTWAYLDSYAIYNPAPGQGHEGDLLFSQHPEWVLKDTSGNYLFIPWGCQNNSCPQYAADIGNQAYRDYFINRVKQTIAAGQKGVYLDDVDMDTNTGNNLGQLVTPKDPRTGVAMTDDNWKKYFAEFMEQVRTGIPNAEIVHNPIWFAGGGNHDATNPYIIRQMKAANWAAMERGMCDGGLTGGTGVWSVYAYFRYVDNIHSYGSHVYMQAYCSTIPDQEWNLAGYLLANNGGDTISASSLTGIRPGWWPGHDMNLGDATGSRTRSSDGLYRRDFTSGVVLLNEPGATTKNINLGSTYYNASGQAVTSVTLAARQAAVLHK